MSPGFSSPPNPAEFNAQVWAMVRKVPAGKVATYGQIAGLLAVPEGMNPRDYQAFSPRWVGGAMAACPEGVPWQRIINSQGKISPRPGAEEQRRLLEEEGVEFNARDRVDLKRYQWAGPEQSQQEQQASFWP